VKFVILLIPRFPLREKKEKKIKGKNHYSIDIISSSIISGISISFVVLLTCLYLNPPFSS